MSWEQFGLTLILGASVGFLSGIFGVGGGFLIVPLLNILLNIPMELAVGAGSCQVLGPATTSILARRISKAQLQLPLTILGGLMIGVFCGTSTLQLASQAETVTVRGNQIPMTDCIVLLTYFFLLSSVGMFALWESRRTKPAGFVRQGVIARILIPPTARLPEFQSGVVSLTVLGWFGLSVGFLAGLLGMSGGLILLPGLIYLLGLKTHQAVVSSILIVWLVAIPATMAHAWNGNVDLWLVSALLIGGTVGARIGSEFSQKVGGVQLRRSFGWLLLATAALIAFRMARLMLK